MKKKWVFVLPLLAAMPAFGEQAQRSGLDTPSQTVDDSSPRENPLSTLPEDFVDVHLKIATEIQARTGRTLLDVPYSVQWGGRDAKITLRNPKTGAVESFRVERVGSSCC